MPAYPAVEIAATASPTGITFCVPARRNRIGTRFDAPSANQKETRHGECRDGRDQQGREARDRQKASPEQRGAVPDTRHDSVSAETTGCHRNREQHVAYPALRHGDQARTDQEQRSPVEDRAFNKEGDRRQRSK